MFSVASHATEGFHGAKYVKARFSEGGGRATPGGLGARNTSQAQWGFVEHKRFLRAI